MFKVVSHYPERKEELREEQRLRRKAKKPIEIDGTEPDREVVMAMV